jgi:hypothetical protein
VAKTSGSRAKSNGAKVPSGLSPAAKALWKTITELPRVEAADWLTVNRLAYLEDEAQALRAIINEDGPMLKQPIVSPTGQVLGETRYAHPGLAQLRRIGREAGELCVELGLTPAARKALGLTVVDAGPPDVVDFLKEKRRKRRAAAGIEA